MSEIESTEGKFKFQDLLARYEAKHGKTVGVMDDVPEGLGMGGVCCWADVQPGEKQFEISQDDLKYGTVVDQFGRLSLAMVIDGKSLSLSATELFELGQWATQNGLVVACNQPTEDGEMRFNHEAAREMYLSYLKGQPEGLWDFLSDEALDHAESEIKKALVAEQQIAMQKSLNDGKQKNRAFIMKLAEAASCRTDTERDEILNDAELIGWLKSTIADGELDSAEH